MQKNPFRKISDKAQDVIFEQMANVRKDDVELYPDLHINELRRELRRVKYNKRFARALWSTVSTLIVAAAAAVLIATLWLPVLHITGDSMQPTLHEGQILVAVTRPSYEKGEIVAFNYNNKVLVKRVIATAGDWVSIADNGTVYVNNIQVEEPYVTRLYRGSCDIEFPYQIPESEIFVLGDNRPVSLDSRNSSIGCIMSEQLVGEVTYCIWPLQEFGKLE